MVNYKRKVGKMYIQIFTAGGTIDKEYFDKESEYSVGEPFIKEILLELNMNFEYEITTIMRKDSLDMTDEDRQIILSEIIKSPHKRIILTHGTDTMQDTAKVLEGIKDKTIVLTGSLKPGKFHKTDAVFNIGFALGALQQLPFGVYICMNGMTFLGNAVKKNRNAGRFEGKTIE